MDNPLERIDAIGDAAAEKLTEAAQSGAPAEAALAATEAALSHLDEGSPAAPALSAKEIEAVFVACRQTLKSGDGMRLVAEHPEVKAYRERHGIAPGPTIDPAAEHPAIAEYRQKWNLPAKQPTPKNP
jgi:alkylhydroperoxidase family enzyme